MSSERLVIVIVDDEPSVLSALRARLRTDGFEVHAFSCSDELFASGFWQRAACILLDVRLPVMNGLDLLKSLRAKGCYAPIVVISAYGDASTAVQALKDGAVDYFEKPIDAERLVRRIREVVGDRTTQGTLTRLTKRLAPEEARSLLEEIAPALVLTVFSHLDRSVDARTVRRVADHLCSPQVQDRLRKLDHVRDGILDEMAVCLADSTISANRDSLMKAIEASNALHRLLALEACLVHSGAA
ncbi:MAG: response regulator [Planctomycetota bacterium]